MNGPQMSGEISHGVIKNTDQRGPGIGDLMTLSDERITPGFCELMITRQVKPNVISRIRRLGDAMVQT